jgi:DNA helicase-2/ATP-dependent DNA helicase PcrA
LGQHSALLALADPEQRIYDWIGADPERLSHFVEAFSPRQADLSTVNHRSAGTEIVEFGNDLLSGRFQKKSYSGVDLCQYAPYGSQAMTKLVTTTFMARKRLVDSGRKDWSVAILVPTKRMTRLVADALRSPPADMPAINHTAVLELEASILSAEVIAYLMQPDVDGHFEQFIDLMCNYFHGRGGDNLTQADLNEAQKLQSAYDELRDRQASGKPIRRSSILVAMIAVYDEVQTLGLSGDPYEDWLTTRRVLDSGNCTRMKGLAEDVRNIRLLERGTQLRQELSQDWRDNGAYANALAITQQAFVREHFAMNSKRETGVVVMNMHKAKGKQFDEVIIFEGWPKKFRGQIVGNPDRIVRSNLREKCDSQARQNLRVSVTRGKLKTTILTPQTNPCVLLGQGD